MYDNTIIALREYLTDDRMAEHLMKQAADAIEELTAINERQLLEIAVLSKSRWIPVAERLPDVDEDVLIYFGYSGFPWVAWVDEDGRWNTTEFIIDKDDEPTAWMPLPEPPDEKT